MSVLFVLQNNLVDRITGPVAQYCRDNNVDFIDASLAGDFSFDTWEELLNHPSNHRIPYGSVGWVKRATESNQFKNVNAFNEMFDVYKWLDIFGDDVVNSDGREHLGPNIHFDHQYHIRPLNEDKAVVGGVYDLEKWQDHIKDRQIENATFWISPLKTIDAEIRCWIIDGEVVGASFYRKNGEQHRVMVDDLGIIRVAQRFASKFETTRPFVMDLAMVDGKWKLMETNPIYASGWYAMEPEIVLRKL